jgi:uncharacterized phage protein gp47/JayE
MPKKRKTFGSFQAESMNFLLANTPFNNVVAGSAIRSIADIMNTQMAELSSQISRTSSMVYLDTASGYYLDLIGSLFGLSRGRSDTYTTTAGDKNIKFYVTGVNTLKRVIGSNTISAGVILTNTDDSASLTVSSQVDFNDTDTFVFVGATLSSETSVNIGPNTMTTHSLAISNLFVTNTSGIVHSMAIESDDSFRNRISSASVASEGANESRIATAIQQFQDIANIDIRPGVSGSGSYDVYLIPTGNRISQSTIIALSRILSNTSGFGITFNIREFDYIPIKIEIQVKFINSANDSLKESTINVAESRVQSLIGSLRPGDELAMNRIIAEVINTDNSISNAEVIFLCINKRVQAIRDLRLEEDELFVPDEDEINPIMVRQ